MYALRDMALRSETCVCDMLQGFTYEKQVYAISYKVCIEKTCIRNKL